MRLRNAQHRLTRSARRAAVPVLRGNGRGLRVRFGDSALARVVSNVEPDVEDVFLSHLHAGDVVYDLGANIGWYSLLAAKAVGPSGRVLAFEPSLLNAALVQQNAAGNHFQNVSVVAAAATDQDGWMTFLDKGNLQSRLDKDDSDAQAERRSRREQHIKGRTLVPVTTLDSWMAQTGQPPPSLVKMDVQGAELGVLRGMTQILADSKPTLIIELHGTRTEVADFLDGVGYQHAPIELDGPTRGAPSWAHVLAQPASTGAGSH
jgi:FkbM family methyltransferase